MIREIEEAIADYRGDVQMADLRLRERLRTIVDNGGSSALEPGEGATAGGDVPPAASPISRRRGVRSNGAATAPAGKASAASAAAPVPPAIDLDGHPAPASRPGRGKKGLRPAGAPVTPAPALRTGEARCPECGRPFDRNQALGSHRFRAHGVRAGSGAPTARPKVEKWVCSRCPESFPSRAQRDRHETAIHPPVDGLKPVGRDPQATARIGGTQIA